MTIRKENITRVYCDTDSCRSVEDFEVAMDSNNWILGTVYNPSGSYPWAACRDSHIKGAVIAALDGETEDPNDV